VAPSARITKKSQPVRHGALGGHLLDRGFVAFVTAFRRSSRLCHLHTLTIARTLSQPCIGGLVVAWVCDRGF
jgi:hypothetical protein